MEQLFKDKLGQDRYYEISEAFTSDLEKRLAARGSGKSRKGLWIFSSIVLLALLSFTAIYFSSDSSQSTNELVSNNSETEQSVSTSENTSSENTNELNSNQSYNTIKAIESVEGGSSVNYNNGGLNSSSNSSSGGSSSYSENNTNSDFSTKLNSTKSSSSTSTGNSGSYTGGSNSSVKMSGTKTNGSLTGNDTSETGNTFENNNNRVEHSDNNSSDEFEESSSELTSVNENSNENKNQDNQQTITPLNDTDGKEDEVNDLPSDSIENIQRDEDLDLQANNEVETDSSDTADLEEVDSTENLEPDIEINNDPIPKKVIYEIFGFGGIDLTKAKMMAANAESGDTFNQNQVSKITGQYGLGLNMNFNRFYAGIGVSMNSYKDEVYYDSWNYNTTYTDSILFTTIDSIVYDSSQVPIDTISYTIAYDTLQIATTDSTSISNLASNTYKILAIPLSFGYTFEYKNWAFRPRLSAIFELNRQSIVANYPMSANGNAIEQFSSLKFGMSMAFDFQIQHNFGNFHVFLRPGYRLRLTNMAESTGSGIKHHSFQTVGGLGYYFGK